MKIIDATNFRLMQKEKTISGIVFLDGDISFWQGDTRIDIGKDFVLTGIAILLTNNKWLRFTKSEPGIRSHCTFEFKIGN